MTINDSAQPFQPLNAPNQQPSPALNIPRGSSRKEKIRRQIVRCIFIIYWLLIFEGALRKWVFPGLEKPIYFIRYPLTLWVYCLALSGGKWPKHILLTLGVVLSLLLGMLSVVQAMTYGIPMMASFFGWSMYCYFIPLAFIIGENFRGEDLKKLIKQILMMAIPLGLLAVKQYTAGPTAAINKTIGEVVYTETGLAGGSIARVIGTFTFFHAQQIYVGTIVACLVATWILPRRDKPVKGILLIIASLAVAATMATDFTRGSSFLAAFGLIGAGSAAIFARKGKIKAKAMVIPILLILSSSAVFSMGSFSKAKELRDSRMAGESGDSTTSRIQTMFKSYGSVMRVDIMGYGVGVSGRGGQVSSEGAYAMRAAGEDEWMRIIVECGPLFGWLYIIYRMALVIVLGRGAIRAVTESSNPFPLAIFCVMGPVIFIWYICHIGTINGYGWLFAGFCLAANRLGKNPSPRRSLWD